MTDTPSSGVEPPARFMMGLEDDPTDNDALMDAAIAKAFPSVEPNDVTVGNPNNVTDDAGEGDSGEDGEPSTEIPVDGNEPPAGDDDTETQGHVQGGDGNDVATGEVDFAALFTQRYGRAPQPQEYEGLLQLAEWANNLTPEQQEAINRALAGGQVQEQVSPPSPAPEPTIENPALRAAIEQYGEDDPIVQYMRSQEEELATLRQSYQNDFAQKRQQEAVVAINAASESFKAKVEIDDADLQRLQGAVTNAGIFPAFVQANRGNVELAMQAALDWAYWQDEPLREKELAKRIASHPATQQQHKARQTKAASVTGTGGNGASRTDAPSKASNDPWAQVAQGLREAQNNGVPS